MSVHHRRASPRFHAEVCRSAQEPCNIDIVGIISRVCWPQEMVQTSTSVLPICFPTTIEDRMKLTKSSVGALTLPVGKTDHIEWDDAVPGLGIRLRGDSRRWIVQYRIGRQQRRESLGDVRAITIESARRIAQQRFALV